MDKQMILKAIADGKYEIKLENGCDCSIDWEIIDGELQQDISSDCCWVGKVMYISDEYICEKVAYEELKILSENITKDELGEAFEEIGLDLYTEMKFDEDNTDNDVHDIKLSDALKCFINDNDYNCYIQYPRNFANEYTCILVSKDVDDIPDGAEPILIEEFVDRYLRKDDAATKYDIGFKFVEENIC